MFGGAVRSIFDESCLEASWKVFFLSLGIELGNTSFNLSFGTYRPHLWLANEQISIEIESYSNRNRAGGKPTRYQEAAEQSNFPILCIKGIALPNRYSVRLFAPRDKAHAYPKFYWATFAEGAGQKLCLLEGNKCWYLQNSASIDSTAALAPQRDSELILKAFDCANSARLSSREYQLSCGFAE
ncbi:hypothetical protein KBF38_02975 [bacterium]|nr:hypothetical protein [bacterium]